MFGCHEFGIFPFLLGISNHPNWRTHIFQRGGLTTNQVCYSSYSCPPQKKNLKWDVRQKGVRIFRSSKLNASRQPMATQTHRLWLNFWVWCDLPVLSDSHMAHDCGIDFGPKANFKLSAWTKTSGLMIIPSGTFTDFRALEKMAHTSAIFGSMFHVLPL